LPVFIFFNRQPGTGNWQLVLAFWKSLPL